MVSSLSNSRKPKNLQSTDNAGLMKGVTSLFTALSYITSIMAAKGTKSRLAATTTLALPIMFRFAWSSGASAKTAQLAAAPAQRSCDEVLSNDLGLVLDLANKEFASL